MAPACLASTEKLLRLLFEAGFKISRKNVQCCHLVVSFLGRLLSQSGTSMSPSHRKSIFNHPLPGTVKEMLSFLGLMNFSRHYILDFEGWTAPLRALVNAVGRKNLTHPLAWTPDDRDVFNGIKQDLSRAAALAIPDYAKSFYLDVSERGATACAVLFQKKGGERKVLMYASIILDRQEQKTSPCARYAAALAKVLQKTGHVVLNHPLAVLTSHSTVAFVLAARDKVTLPSWKQRARRQQTRLQNWLPSPDVYDKRP